MIKLGVWSDKNVMQTTQLRREWKQAILEQEYGIKGDVEGGVSSMCNLSDLIVEEYENAKRFLEK